MNRLLLTALTAALISCSTKAPVYQSVDEYPVKKGSLEEMHYTPAATTFSLWSPAADAVYLNLYPNAETDEASERLPMKRHSDGSWTLTVRRDLNGQFYTFLVSQASTQWQLHETPGIFCKAVGINGRRAAILDLRTTDPEGWDSDQRPALAGPQDAIIYEMHHRDFSIHPSSGIEHRGKFLALTEHGTLSPEGLATGIDHLLELGVTHVQILPSYDFGSIDEEGTSSEATVLESGAAAGGSYNWGYDPLNYNVPEGSYCTNPREPACRIREFKQMVQALHQAGIRVIMDVVYNHVYDAGQSPFTQTCPDYFFRTNPDNSLSNASGCGNETASNRPMMRRFILESIRYWVEEYHVDGFRFDLMAIHDIETMNEVRQLLNDIDPSLLLYGEGWTAGTAQYPTDLLALKANIQQMPGIGAFCDDMRDGLRGPFFDDHIGAFLAYPYVNHTNEQIDSESTSADEQIASESTATDAISPSRREYLSNLESIKAGIVGCISHPDVDYSLVNHSSEPWTLQPTQCIAYVSCHDDMMLTDRLRASIHPDAATANIKEKSSSAAPSSTLSDTELARLDKLAQTAVLTSNGLPFLWCGEEVMRDKKGVHNSFCSPDSINQIDWTLKASHHDLFAYYKGLIALRKAHPAFRLADAEKVRTLLHFLPATSFTAHHADSFTAPHADLNATHDADSNSTAENVIGWTIDGKAAGDSWSTIIVVLNASKDAVTFPLPTADTYTAAVYDGQVLYGSPLSAADSIFFTSTATVAPQSALILHL